MNAKLAALLAELDSKRCFNDTGVFLKPSEYDLLREALREREGMVLVPSDAQESLRDKILSERDKGNLVYAHVEGYSAVSIEDFVTQPVEGMLYDLNRGEEISLTFITDKKWVNDFAVALVIRKLAEQRDAALGRSPQTRAPK